MSENDYKLLPCPFCGGEAQFSRGFDYGENGAIRWVSCTRCGAMTRSGLHKTEAYAALVWNTRAERTCRNVDKTGIVGRFECSECGWIEADEPIYCGGCGAKVEP